jgi:hypothetical protein
LEEILGIAHTYERRLNRERKKKKKRKKKIIEHYLPRKALNFASTVGTHCRAYTRSDLFLK